MLLKLNLKVMKILYKVLIYSVLCFLLIECKSTSDTKKKNKIEREDTTDDVRDDQMNDYEMEMNQQNNQ